MTWCNEHAIHRPSLHLSRYETHCNGAREPVYVVWLECLVEACSGSPGGHEWMAICLISVPLETNHIAHV